MGKNTCIEIILICLVMNMPGFANGQTTVATPFLATSVAAAIITPMFTTLFKDLKTTAQIEIARTSVALDTSKVPNTTVKRIATPIGTTVSCVIDVEGVGPSEYGQHELHDVKITVLEVVRGNKARELLRAADASNRPPDIGFDYFLARIRFEYSMQRSQGDMPYTLNQGCFKLYSADNKEYAAPSIAPPKPELIGTVFYSGVSYEGWVPFMAATNDKPLMFYTLGSVWFEL